MFHVCAPINRDIYIRDNLVPPTMRRCKQCRVMTACAPKKLGQAELVVCYDCANKQKNLKGWM